MFTLFVLVDKNWLPLPMRKLLTIGTRLLDIQMTTLNTGMSLHLSLFI